MKNIKLKSNHLRNSRFTLDGVSVVFDAEGIAFAPHHTRRVFEKYNLVRPGRITIVVEDKPVVQEPKKEVRPALVNKDVTPEHKVEEFKDVVTKKADPEDKPKRGRKPSVKKPLVAENKED